MEIRKIGDVDIRGDDESRDVYYLVSDVESLSQVEKEIDGFYSQEESIFAELYARCSCSHDCCGHWFSNGLEAIHHDDVYKTAVVKASYGRNV